MDVLYQFWSHFLIRNFNTRMYDEFRHFAFEDAAHNFSEVGLTNLIMFYGKSLLSPENFLRDRAARDCHSRTVGTMIGVRRSVSFDRFSAALPWNHVSEVFISDLLDADLRSSLE